MKHFSNSIEALKADEDSVKKQLLGGLILGLSIFIIPGVFLYGYMIQILKDTETRPLKKYPEWTNWGDLFINGLLGIVIYLIVIIPIQLLINAPILFEVANIESAVGMYALVIAGYLLSMFVGYVLPIVYAMVFRESGDLTDWSRLKAIIFSKEYFLAYLVLLAFGFGVGILIVMLILFTFGLGLFFLPFVYFLIYCISMYVFGSAITEADPEISQADPTSEEETTVTQLEDENPPF